MSVVSVEKSGDLSIVTVNNPPVNATSRAVRQGLIDAVVEVQGQRLAILKCAGRTFIAGGDMSEFDRPAEEPHLPAVANAIEESETPFVAVLHGNVLGGGLEIAMACAFRIAAPGTRLGLPEVNVGLIPGAGGTQRAPRLFGMEAAIDLACSGKILSAEEALSLGAVDAIDADPESAARRLVAARPVPVSRRVAEFPPANWLSEKRATLVNRARGQNAPLHNFDALKWAALPFEEGLSRERALHLKLRQSDESRALRHAFFAERAVSRPKLLEGGTARDIDSVVVVGGGLMGAGIAAAFLMAGCTVTLIERDDLAALAGQERVVGLLKGALKRGKLTQQGFEARCAAFMTTTHYADARNAELAIEAVFEDIQVKREVFENLSKFVSDTCMLATNTSYLDPVEIFEVIAPEGRCLGLHFFSPAHIMKLVEVVHLPNTSVDTLASAFALTKRLRKIAVLSGICDGFIGNRMLAAYRRAAEYMLADGATPEAIDAAMKYWGFAMGPFEAQDMGGLQIAEANRRRQDATRNPTERYVTISDRLCALGRYGQRSGKGWYIYPDGSRTPQADPEVAAIIENYSAEQNIRRQAFSTEEIQTRLLAVLANEGARIVEERIAENDASVDMVKIHGYGFPRWRGGPMHAAKAVGDAIIKAALDRLEADSPNSWVRARRYQ